jgi:uncharacterized protein YbjT (DUF2867 family)
MNTIAVTGVTGQVGSAVAARLAAEGHSVVGIGRTVDSPAVAGAGYRGRVADLDDPQTFAVAVRGADVLFLLATGSHPAELVASATAEGVHHIVVLSSQGAGTRPDAYPGAAAFESAVRGSGAGWTILRPSGYASNTFGWAAGVRENRTVFAPFGDVALPVIDPADIAATAAAVLAAPDVHAGAVYELTGPAAVTPREQALAIADAIGVPLDFVELSRDEALRAMSLVMPAAVAEATLGILGDPSERERTPSPDVERLLLRPAASFAEWTTRNVGAFRPAYDRA